MRFLIFLSLLLSACGSDVGSNLNNVVDISTNDMQVETFDMSDATSNLDALGDAILSDVGNDVEVTPPVPLIVGEDSRTLRPNELVECNCPNPDDACSAMYRCVLKAHGCFIDEDCPSAYRCFENMCVNKRESEFAPTCVVDENCPFYYKCSSGSCTGTPSCDTSQDCSANEICGEVPNYGATVCRTPGPNIGGETCESGYECASGFCTDGKCRTACVRNGDCLDEHICEPFGICSLNARPDERLLCGAGVESALSVNASGCASRFCRVNADCPTGTCTSIFCADNPSPTICKPNEFHRGDGSDLCFIGISCRGDTMCPTTYSCVYGTCARPG